MKIVLSAHMDFARPIMSIKMDDKNLIGLLDNYAGVFVAYQASRKTGTSVFFTNYEELDYDGADSVAKSLDKDTFVIVIDTILEKDVKGKTASITNAYNLETYWDDMKTEFSNDVHFIDGLFEPTEDETTIYGNRYSFKTIYFGVPIPGDYYHSTELSLELSKIDLISELLVKLIEFVKNK